MSLSHVKMFSHCVYEEYFLRATDVIFISTRSSFAILMDKKSGSALYYERIISFLLIDIKLHKHASFRSSHIFNLVAENSQQREGRLKKITRCEQMAYVLSIIRYIPYIYLIGESSQ